MIFLIKNTMSVRSLQSFMVKLFIGSFHFYNSKYKEKTNNDHSALYSLGSCPLAVVIGFPYILKCTLFRFKRCCTTHQSCCLVNFSLTEALTWHDIHISNLLTSLKISHVITKWNQTHGKEILSKILLVTFNHCETKLWVLYQF